MSKVTICDRCKKQIDHNDQALLTYCTKPLWNGNETRIDLCLNCWKYVKEYIETNPNERLNNG